jgi:hypothetical protein
VEQEEADKVTYRAFTRAKQDEFLEYLRAGMQRGAAADALGLSRIKVREFILSNKAYERFVLDAEVDATEHVQEALYQAAVSGSVAAAKTWLEFHPHTNPVAPSRPAPAPPSSSDPFADLDNVASLDPRRRRRR